MPGKNYSTKKIDALTEIANIGSGNAATALSQILNHKIEMKVPEIKILPFSEVPDQVGGAEQIAVGLYMEVSGSAPCNILFLFPMSSSLVLIDMMMENKIGTTQEIGQMEASALCEMVNVVGVAYLNAMAKFTGIDFIPSVPSLAIDMAGAILNSLMVQLSMSADQALLLETDFVQVDVQVTGNFFLLPEGDSLDIILQNIGVRG